MHGISYWPRCVENLWRSCVWVSVVLFHTNEKKGGQLEKLTTWKVICFSISHTLVLKRFSQQLVGKPSSGALFTDKICRTSMKRRPVSLGQLGLTWLPGYLGELATWIHQDFTSNWKQQKQICHVWIHSSELGEIQCATFWQFFALGCAQRGHYRNQRREWCPGFSALSQVFHGLRCSWESNTALWCKCYFLGKEPRNKKQKISRLRDGIYIYIMYIEIVKTRSNR